WPTPSTGRPVARDCERRSRRRTFHRQRPGHGLADASTPPGDDGALARQLQIHPPIVAASDVPDASKRVIRRRSRPRMPKRSPVTDQQTKAAEFLALHRGPTPLLMPNPWDAGAARLLASLGFGALATTSSGFAATLGRLDGSVTREEAL